MSLMGTLAKLAIGYAAARGVDRLSGGQGLGTLLGGGAQVKSRTGAPAMPEQMKDLMAGKMPEGGAMADMMKALQTGTAGGANPMAEFLKSMQSGGMDLSAIMGRTAAGEGGGLLSQLGAGGTGLSGMMATMAGAAAGAQAQGAGAMLDAVKAGETAPEAEKAAGLLLRAMIMAAKSDGGIDKAEQAKILETLGADADAGDRAFVQAQLAAPVDPAALAADTPPPMRTQVYSASLMTIRVDTQAEADYLDRLARALELDEATVNMLHLQMGLQPLYG